MGVAALHIHDRLTGRSIEGHRIPTIELTLSSGLVGFCRGGTDPVVRCSVVRCVVGRRRTPGRPSAQAQHPGPAN